MTLKKYIGGLTAAVIFAGAYSPIAAHSDEEKERFPESQYRHDVMEHFSSGFKKIGLIMKGQAGQRSDIAAIAGIMANAATMTKASFEKDTRGIEGHTEAKDAIWDNWQDFSSRLDTLATDSAAFAEAAKTGDMSQIGAAMKKVGGSCKSCHDKYKEG